MSNKNQNKTQKTKKNTKNTKNKHLPEDASGVDVRNQGSVVHSDKVLNGDKVRLRHHRITCTDRQHTGLIIKNHIDLEKWMCIKKR